jgi:hypothetical protein
MNHLLFSSPFKQGMQAVVALTILLFSLAPGGTRTAYAAPPIHDDFGAAKTINNLTYSDAPVITTEATPTNLIPNVDDPDNINCDGTGSNNLNAGYATVWYKYTPGTTESIAIDTLQSNYDTFIAVWTGTRGNLNLVACNDDNFAGFQSDLFFIGSSGTTYYIEVAQFSYYEGDPPPDPAPPIGGTLQFHAYISTTNVSIHGTVMGNYSIPQGGSLRTAYANVDDGPAKITNTNGADGISALRVIWQEPGFRSSYSEMMGLPKEQLSTEYWFPWYNNKFPTIMDQGFRFGMP